MPTDEKRSEIREAFIARCNPHQFQEPWDFLPAHDEVRCLPSEPARLMLELREAYSDDALFDAGVAEFGEDDGRGNGIPWRIRAGPRVGGRALDSDVPGPGCDDQRSGR